MFHLRDYQHDAIRAVFTAWSEGTRRPAIVLPTGAGKTVVFAHLIRQFRERRSGADLQRTGTNGNRVIVLVHRDELADQAMSKIRSIAPDLSVGKVKAADNEITADVMVCSVQTLASRSRRGRLQAAQHSAGRVGLVITDECHHAVARTYQDVYAAFPDALQLGVTATLARGDEIGLGSQWERVVYSRSILWMISKGFLTDVSARRVETSMDLSHVKTNRGDLAAGDLAREMAAEHVDAAIARAYREHAADRQGIVFAPTVASALDIQKAMTGAGIPARTVTGDTPRDERLGTYEAFRTGSTQVLVNAMVLTEGFDAPWASCAVIARPTQSQPLYVQMVGRVLRPWPGKKDALVLDVVGATASNKLRTLVDLQPGAVAEIGEETLAEAAVREAEEGNQVVPRGSVAFSLKYREVSLFGSSQTAWLTTRAGVMFIACGAAYVFLWPSTEGAGLWDVRVAAGRARKWPAEKSGLDLASAMAWGESVAEDHGLFSVKKDASWRGQKPRVPQIQKAVSDGVSLTDASRMTRGELADAVEMIHASRKFDGFAKQA